MTDDDKYILNADGTTKPEKETEVTTERKKGALYMGEYIDLGGGYVIFGTYPQSKKASNIILGQVFDRKRGYYLGADNCLHEKCGGEYYKVEPIKWKVLSHGSECFLISDMILETLRFDSDSNDYAQSEIRGWLNVDFYNKAFREEQKSKIITTTVDNGLASTGDGSNSFICGNTSDKVFLLSREEASRYLNSDESRKIKSTDYAKNRGLLYDIDDGNSRWWLRSPYHSCSYSAQTVRESGEFAACDVYLDHHGVLPALRIKP